MSKNDKRTPTQRLARKDRHRREHARKVYHTTLESAQKSALEVTQLRPDEYPREAYECRWAEEWELGETAMMHWHVGRPQGSEKLLNRSLDTP